MASRGKKKVAEAATFEEAIALVASQPDDARRIEVAARHFPALSINNLGVAHARQLAGAAGLVLGEVNRATIADARKHLVEYLHPAGGDGDDEEEKALGTEGDDSGGGGGEDEGDDSGGGDGDGADIADGDDGTGGDDGDGEDEAADGVDAAGADGVDAAADAAPVEEPDGKPAVKPAVKPAKKAAPAKPASAAKKASRRPAAKSDDRPVTMADLKALLGGRSVFDSAPAGVRNRLPVRSKPSDLLGQLGAAVAAEMDADGDRGDRGDRDGRGERDDRGDADVGDRDDRERRGNSLRREAERLAPDRSAYSNDAVQAYHMLQQAGHRTFTERTAGFSYKNSRNRYECVTLAAAIDALERGETVEATNILIGRLLCVEVADSHDGDWDRGAYFERVRLGQELVDHKSLAEATKVAMQKRRDRGRVQDVRLSDDLFGLDDTPPAVPSRQRQQRQPAQRLPPAGQQQKQAPRTL
jgi:hypothetical protein